ncbi:hypothetical protein [Corallococcus sp. 4LFB]|uniref:hypothetical protein n=1 Tax=Corallococcus sp. 4LFB TaxID=3383249 RepID=UPI0039770D18
MKQWTGFVVVVLSSLAVLGCGVPEEALDAPVLAQQEAGIDICGNGICFRTELSTCPADCWYGGYCGDGTCSGSEDNSICPSDCQPGGCVAPSKPSPEATPVQSIDICGNGICFRTELSTCPADCWYGGYCGDGTCSGSEDNSICPSDCQPGGC